MGRLRAYADQRHKAEVRGIDWQFTYDEWVTWWGDDYQYRGRGKDKLQMCRKNDSGPYHPNNVYKATLTQNVKDFLSAGVKFDEWKDQICSYIQTPDGQFYIAEASRHYGLHRDTICYRLRSNNFTDWYYL